jgi:hypothetical protein
MAFWIWVENPSPFDLRNLNYINEYALDIFQCEFSRVNKKAILMISTD